MHRRLVMGADHVTLLDGPSVVARAAGPTASAFSLRETHRAVERAFARALLRGLEPEALAEIDNALLLLGRHLAEAVPGPVASRLVSAVDAARATGRTLHLGFATSSPQQAALPWETMILPGATTPLALHPVVRPYRLPDAAAAYPGRGPDFSESRLDVLALLSNPLPEDPDAVPAALLDLEAETRRLADVVDRLPDRARLRTIGLGSLDGLARALADSPTDVVHIACHARPGLLLLEDATGRPAPEGAERLTAALVTPTRPGIVVLAGCATAAGPVPRAGDVGAGELPGLAQHLAASGIPRVLAMSTQVSDSYAGTLIAAFYSELAQGAEVLDALQNARISLERARRQDGARRLPEWGAAVLFAGSVAEPARPGARGPHQADRTRPAPPEDPHGRRPVDPGLLPAEAVAAPDVSARPVTALAMPIGEFVGRRSLLRTTVRALSGEGHPALVVHAMGGAGKSSFLGEVLRLLPAARTGLALLSGPLDTDQILAALGATLGAEGYARLADTRVPWRTRLAALTGPPPLLVLDGFEDNLVRAEEGGGLVYRDGEVADFLRLWLTEVPGARTLITSRHPLPLPPTAADRVVHLPLPALSEAETALLRARLPALRSLPHRAWADVQRAIGGHPRTYNYLDALLSGGRTDSADLAARLDRLTDGALPDAVALVDGRPRLALAEASRLAAADVLLADLVAALDGPSRAMLHRTAVFRKPVPATAFTDDDGRRPLRRLVEAGLVSSDDGGDRWLVHRWTATELARLDPQAEAAGHAPAAQYWQGRFEEDGAPLELRLVAAQEAMHHLVESGEKERAVRVASRLCGRLHVSGMWGTEERICSDLLKWMEPGTPDETMTHRQLGLIARDRGDMPGARGHLERALAISEKAGDLRGIAYAQHQLGSVEHEQGLFDAAMVRYRAAADVFADMGLERDAAATLAQISMIDEDLGRLVEARKGLLAAMTVFHRVEDGQALIACHQRLASLAERTGDLASARTHLDAAATICEADGNRFAAAEVRQRIGILLTMSGDHDGAYEAFDAVLEEAERRKASIDIARAHHHLGISAQHRAEHAIAERHFRAALQLNQRLGRIAAEASNRTHLGVLARLSGAPLTGLAEGRRALSLFELTDDTRGSGDAHLTVADCLRDIGHLDEARRAYREALGVHEAFGDALAAEKVRAALDALPVTPPAGSSAAVEEDDPARWNDSPATG